MFGDETVTRYRFIDIATSSKRGGVETFLEKPPRVPNFRNRVDETTVKVVTKNKIAEAKIIAFGTQSIGDRQVLLVLQIFF